MPLTVQALDHLVVQVSNLEVSARWYERVLGMTREDVSPAPGQPSRTEMKFGRQKITSARSPRARRIGSRLIAKPPAARICAFSPTRRRTKLQAHGVAIVAGPGPRRGAQGTLMSVYCRDPDGALIEIASYVDG